MKARPYQLEGIESLWNYFVAGNPGNPLIAMPTGTGKSIMPALFMEKALGAFPNQRMILVTHVKELIEQNYKALLRVWPTAPVGICSSGLGKWEPWAPLVYAGIASIRNSINEIGHRDIMFIDEAQLLSPNDDTMYRSVISQLQYINPRMRIVGLTATPFRMGQGMLTDPTLNRRGEETAPLFTDICFDITGVEPFNKLIDEYYLSPLIPKRVESMIDVSDVRQLANDFNQNQLIEAIANQNVTGRALREAMELASDRKSWIVFGAGIKNCEEITAILNSFGVVSCCVHSDMDEDSRDNRLKGFKEGVYRAIVSNNILTTGFDHPQTDCIVDLRPTTSVVLHVQKYGRGTRPYFHPRYNFEQLAYIEYRKEAIFEGGKRNCLVLDFAGNTNRLGPINDPRTPSRKKKVTGEVPIKICESCGTYNHTTARFCCNPDCGEEFIFATKIKPNASTAEVIYRPEADIKYHNVSNVQRFIHPGKDSKPPSLKLLYYTDAGKMFNHYLCFEHGGLAKHKSHEWWRQHEGDNVPATVTEAYERFPNCRITRQLKIDESGQYPSILEFLF